MRSHFNKCVLLFVCGKVVVVGMIFRVFFQMGAFGGQKKPDFAAFGDKIWLGGVSVVHKFSALGGMVFRLGGGDPPMGRYGGRVWPPSGGGTGKNASLLHSQGSLPKNKMGGKKILLAAKGSQKKL